MPLRNVLVRVVAAATLCTGLVEAQAGRTDSLPRPLVEALFGSMGGGRYAVRIRVGVIDSALARELTHDAIPLGSAMMGSGLVSVVQYAYGSDAALDTVRARLLRSGYREMPGALGPRPRGLSSSSSMVSIGPPGLPTIGLCGSDHVLRASASSQAPQAPLVITTQRDARSYSFQCSADGERERAMFDPMRITPLPELPPPRGMFSAGGGSSGSPEDGGMQQAELEGSVPLPRVHAHYDSVFTASSWQRVEGASGASFGTSVFEHRTAEGETWRATLTLTSVAGSGQVDVALSTRASRRQ